VHKAGFVTVFLFIFVTCFVRFSLTLVDVCWLQEMHRAGWRMMFSYTENVGISRTVLSTYEVENYFFQTNPIKFGKGQYQIFILMCLACFHAYE